MFDTIRGHRRELFFHNTNPVVLELACGRGEYSLGLAQQFPERNFIGIDRKGERFRAGAKQVTELGLQNIGFLRIIIQHLDRFFVPDEVDEMRLVHPDPRPKGADERRRLTHPRFIQMYRNILKPGGLLRLKTDDPNLFTYSLDMFRQQEWQVLDYTNDLYSSPLLADHFGIQTHYEKLFAAEGCTIHYAIFQNIK